MTGAELRDTLDRIGLTKAEAAQLLDVTPRTVQNWISGTHAVPGAVDRLLRTWLRRPEVRPPRAGGGDPYVVTGRYGGEAEEGVG